MIPSFEKRVRGFSIDTSLTFLLIILLLGFPVSVTVRQILLVVVMIGVYLVPYIICPGQTFGKRTQKTKIINNDGSDANVFKLLARDAFKVIVGIATFGIYLVVCVFLMDEKAGNRALHDKLFKTKVIDLNVKRNHRASGTNEYLNRSESLQKRGL